MGLAGLIAIYNLAGSIFLFMRGYVRRKVTGLANSRSSCGRHGRLRLLTCTVRASNAIMSRADDQFVRTALLANGT